MQFFNIKREWYLIEKFKKHICPKCQSKMFFIKCCEIVEPKTERAKDFDWSQAGGDGYMVGRTKFIWNELKCNNCDLQLTLKDFNSYTKYDDRFVKAPSKDLSDAMLEAFKDKL
ncbi:MAG: hypothetical protein RR436_03865, partial [Clostridia bacterium]